MSVIITYNNVYICNTPSALSKLVSCAERVSNPGFPRTELPTIVLLQGGMRSTDVDRAINCSFCNVRPLRQSYRMISWSSLRWKNTCPHVFITVVCVRACSLQSYICTRWTRLLSGWTGYFSAALDGCASGLSSQDAHQRGCRSGFCLTQAPENCNRPGSAHHQSHSDWTLYVQPHCVGAPPLAHDDGDERGHDNGDTIPFLDAPILSGSLFGPAVEGFAECFTEAQKSSQAMKHLLP